MPRTQLASYDGPTITAFLFDSASIPRLMQDLNDLLFGMPLARSLSFANDFTWTCGFRAPARGFGDVCGEAFRLGRSLSDNRRSYFQQRVGQPESENDAAGATKKSLILAWRPRNPILRNLDRGREARQRNCRSPARRE